MKNCCDIYPILYQSLVYFFTPSVTIADLQYLKEELTQHLIHLLIKDDLATYMFKLCRFSTLNEEIKLAERILQNQSRTLSDLGVDKLFCLNQHLDYLHQDLGLSSEDITNFFDLPYQHAIKLVKTLDRREDWSPQDKMDYIEKISRSLIAEIDDYFVNAESEKKKAVKFQNRYKQFKKLEQAYQEQNGYTLEIDYDKMYG